MIVSELAGALQLQSVYRRNNAIYFVFSAMTRFIHTAMGVSVGCVLSFFSTSVSALLQPLCQPLCLRQYRCYILYSYRSMRQVQWLTSPPVRSELAKKRSPVRSDFAKKRHGPPVRSAFAKKRYRPSQKCFCQKEVWAASRKCFAKKSQTCLGQKEVQPTRQKCFGQKEVQPASQKRFGPKRGTARQS